MWRNGCGEHDWQLMDTEFADGLTADDETWLLIVSVVPSLAPPVVT